MKWVTREKARVDRIACPWLIARFVDPAPEFVFVPDRDVLAVAKRDGALPYDVPGVELGHHGARCSFDAFVERYELDDPALAALAPIVRGADTDARGLTPESAGLYAAASGFRAMARDDHDNMRLQFPLYDALYAHCRETAPAPAARPRVLFACLHGAAKSVVAAAHFRRLAAARGLEVAVSAVGTEPDGELTPAAAKGLAADGLAPTIARPRPVTLHDVATAVRIVSFGCDLEPWLRAPGRAGGPRQIDRWDVPAVGEGYAAARDAIVARLERLAAEMAP
jgi:protein-tyrosine-phosphatase